MQADVANLAIRFDPGVSAPVRAPRQGLYRASALVAQPLSYLGTMKEDELLATTVTPQCAHFLESWCLLSRLTLLNRHCPHSLTFYSADVPFQPLFTPVVGLLELCGLRLSLSEDRNVWVGVLPVRGNSHRRYGLSSCHLKNHCIAPVDFDAHHDSTRQRCIKLAYCIPL